MIKVLVADDHEVVRRGLRQILVETGDILVAAEAGSAGEVMSAAVTRLGATLLRVDSGHNALGRWVGGSVPGGVRRGRRPGRGGGVRWWGAEPRGAATRGRGGHPPDGGRPGFTPGLHSQSPARGTK